MPSCDFTVRVEGNVSVVKVRGHLDNDAAAHLLETAATAAKVCVAVQIDLQDVESMSPEAAGLLLFRSAASQSLPGNIVLQANGEPGRQAVLDAFARQRACPQAG